MARRRVQYDFRPNSIFRAGNIDSNACVGSNGGPYTMAVYGEGFLDGAEQIVEGVGDGRTYADLAVYPVAYCYRHGVELLLKHLLGLLLEYKEAKLDWRKHHDLGEYWSLVEEQLAKADPPIADPQEVPIARDLISDLDQIDPTGEVFRYPSDRDGTPHLIGLPIVNLEVLAIAMRTLRELLLPWIEYTEYLLIERAEMRAAYRNTYGYE